MDNKVVKCIEFFTADNLDDLNRKIREWTREHPDYVVTSGRGVRNKDDSCEVIIGYSRPKEVQNVRH